MKKNYAYVVTIVILVIALVIVVSISRGPAGGNVATAPSSAANLPAVQPAVVPSSAPAAAPVGGTPAAATSLRSVIPAPAASKIPASGGVGTIFVPPATIIGLPTYYDMSSTTDTIRVANPSQGSGVSSPLQVTGLARGQWFFEGSFPIVLVNARGLILARSTAVSQSNWQTTDFVPFSGQLIFAKQPTDSTGAVYFLMDNPSGQASGAVAAVMPVVFQ